MMELTEADKVAASKSLWTDNYVFASLTAGTIASLVKLTSNVGRTAFPLVYKVWLDHPIARCVYTSERTIKCDAVRAAFAAAGKGVVWAVADTGIDELHPHFVTHGTLKGLPKGVAHQDFTQEAPQQRPAGGARTALKDEDGHGTHVAGIIAGETRPSPKKLPGGLVIKRDVRVSDTSVEKVDEQFLQPISGLAPLCKIVSLKVLSGQDDGKLSSLMAAIAYVQRVNDYGRVVKIHGINMSLGYAFDPTWFAAGQSPLCTEVDRLVKCGVLVVVAAGNGGYGTVTTYSGREEVASHAGTINDPGNAMLALTVARPTASGRTPTASRTSPGRDRPGTGA